jgi:hypothetical protein
MLALFIINLQFKCLLLGVSNNYGENCRRSEEPTGVNNLLFFFSPKIIIIALNYSQYSLDGLLINGRRTFTVSLS